MLNTGDADLETIGRTTKSRIRLPNPKSSLDFEPVIHCYLVHGFPMFLPDSGRTIAQITLLLALAL